MFPDKKFLGALAFTLFSAAVVAYAEESEKIPELIRATAASSGQGHRKIKIKEVTQEDIKKFINVGEKLSLKDVVPIALKQNLGIAVSRIGRAITEESPEIQNAAFDPVLAFSSIYDNTGNAYLVRDNSGTSSQNWANELSLSKKFSYGTEAKIYGQFNRAYNTEGTLSPDSSSSFGLSLTQPLLSGFGEGVNLAPLAKARKNVTQSNLNLRKSTLDLIYNTEVAYWNLSASYSLVLARMSSLRHAEFVLEQAKKKRDLKSATKEDVLQAEAEVATRRVSLVSARQSVEDCDDALRKLMGQNGDETLGTYDVAPLGGEFAAETMTFREWIAQVRNFDIDAQIQEIEREKAELDYQVASNSNSPSLDLVLGAEASGRERSPAKAVSGTYDRTGYNLSAGIRFSMPIGFRQSAAELRQAEKARQSAEYSIAEALQAAMFEARSAWRTCEAAMERLAAAKTAMKMQKESYEGQIAKYGAGTSTMTDVLSAQDSLDSARLELIQAALDVVTARVKVIRLDGRILEENGFTWREIDDFETSRSI